ncbi:Metallopeptidase [Lysobacter dokdonensis DS-58]|uniref:Metallopeptidase n=1 Tax=Lysobacter dokdonensis DS-58 TaxID=1300345 RepID=A0A0A2WPS1_9GAMM|nr:M13-type metalloendopeptidase [Lysobacter dokdonensis]KGQ20732.1 Metallopeptidase [Lysobacter dokdonensis DS-58]
MSRKPQVLLLSLSIVAALAACKPGDKAADAAKSADSAAPKLTLDESKLPPVNFFQAGDIDAAKNACTDFNGYVNSKWLAANPIPGDRTSWGAFEMLDERSTAVQRQLAEQAAAAKDASGVQKIVGDLWSTGMDEAKVNAQGIKPIESRLAAVDKLTDADSISAYLRDTAAKGEGTIIGFGPEADFKNSDMTIGYASQSGLGLPDAPYYFDADKKKNLADYETHIVNTLKLAGVPAADAAKQAKDVIAFETRLAKVSKTRTELQRDVSLYYNPVTVADADKITPGFSWEEFFKAQGVAAPKTFSLGMPAFHAEWNKMRSDAPIDQWKSYLRFHVIDEASPYLGDAFVQEHFNFYNAAMRGQKQMQPRWKRVLRTTENQAGEALGQMYVQVAFPAESKARMEKLVQNLRDALKVRLENLAWMSPDTKKKAMEKWAAFTPKIGYPDKWRSWDGLSTSRDSYFGNVMAANEFNYKWEMSKIGKPVDKSEWGMSPQTVNAYYNPLRNEVVFPAAILQPPFFDAKADDATNYGGIGAVIGHEMIHGYDDQGSRFGPTGNFENWWTPADAKGFSGLTGQLVDQFNGYEALPGKHVKGDLTLGENIADLGGLNVAYSAMKHATDGTPDPKTDGFTRDQRFFLNFGTVWRRSFTEKELEQRINTDEHAPANFRAIGAPSNMPEFATAFSCKANDPMVRGDGKRIVIW